MNLLEQLKAIDSKKISDEDIKKELKEAIEMYDERIPETITNAEFLMEMIKDSFPKSIKGNEEKTEGEYVKESEAKEAIKSGKEVVAEIPGGETYTVENNKELKEALKKAHELKVATSDKKNKQKKKQRKRKNWKEVNNFLGRTEKVIKYKVKEVEVKQEEAIDLLEQRNMPTYQVLKSREIERKDGSLFMRSYLDDEMAYSRYEMGMPLYGEAKGGKIYIIKSLPELVQSFNDGHNHFTPTEDMIQEIPVKKMEAKEVDNIKVDNVEPEKPLKKKITKENKDECDKILAEIKALLNNHKTIKTQTPKPAKPAKKKALSVLVKDSVVSIMKRVITREKTSKRKVDVKKFEAAIKKGKEFLVALRKASNGISDDNDQMIAAFEKQMNEIVSTFQDKKAA